MRHLLPYLLIFVAAAVEGEIVFIGASIAVALGRLDAWSVLTAGALGGSAGDQIFFYGFRRGFGRGLERLPYLHRRRNAIVRRVSRYGGLLVASCRFLPGLRIAILAACAYARVSPMQFSSLSVASSFLWAASLMSLVAWAGPKSLSALGIARSWAAVASAAVAIVLFLCFRRITLTTSEDQ